MTNTNSSILPALKEQRAKLYGALDSNSMVAESNNEVDMADQTRLKGAKYYLLNNTRGKDANMVNKKPSLNEYKDDAKNNSFGLSNKRSALKPLGNSSKMLEKPNNTTKAVTN